MTTYAIFGATSAIAEYTARALVTTDAHFFLVARDDGKLEKIATDLRVRGAASINKVIYDFVNLDAIESLVDQTIKSLGTIDQALIAFGTLTDQADVTKNPAHMAKEIAVNFTAAAILSQHITNHMLRQKAGLLAVITSVAGDRGRGSNYVYGSAKGGLGLFLQGLRHKLSPCGVEVLDIRPGFVDTPMTRHYQKGPLWAKPEAVGMCIANAMRAGKGGRFYVPRFWAVIMFVIRIIPSSIFHKTKL
jgi:decaprenylphospho-beta-D-erythro-pentofuranosid-2-ulose 2-reductase